MTQPRPLVFALVTLLSVAVACRATPEAAPPTTGVAIDADLLDVTVPELHRLYADRKYSVTQVVQWHLPQPFSIAPPSSPVSVMSSRFDHSALNAAGRPRTSST